MVRLRTLLCAALLSAATVVPGPALAQDSLVAAEALFREGRDLMQKGDFAAACPKLAESNRLDPSSGTLINLARCYREQGRTATAWATYLAAGRLARQQGKPERADEAKKNADELEPDLSYLTVVVSQPVPGLEVTRGGTRLESSSLGSRLPIDPGEHELTISAPGHKTLTLKVTIGAKRDAQTVTVPALEKEPTTAPPPDGGAAAPAATGGPGTPPAGGEPPSSEAGGGGALPWVVVGLGVVVTGVGVVAGLNASSTYADAEKLCPTHVGCSAKAMTLRDDADGAATLSTVLTGAGVVTLGIGVVLLVTSGGGEPAADAGTAAGARRRVARAPSWQVAPVWAPGAGGAVLRGAF